MGESLDQQIIARIQARGIHYSREEFLKEFPSAPHPYFYYLKVAGRMLRAEGEAIIRAQSRMDLKVICLWGLLLVGCGCFILSSYLHNNIKDTFGYAIFFAIFAIPFGDYLLRVRAERKTNKYFQDPEGEVTT